MTTRQEWCITHDQPALLVGRPPRPVSMCDAGLTEGDFDRPVTCRMATAPTEPGPCGMWAVVALLSRAATLALGVWLIRKALT